MCDARDDFALHAFAAASISLISAMPCSIALRVPPVSWMLKVRSVLAFLQVCAPSSELIWFDSQPRPITSTPAKFGVLRIAAERALAGRA